jgi:predicted ATP-grasp superfamily ATP-dependent carboligase
LTIGRSAKVVVTGGEHFGGLAAIRALARAGHQPCAAVVAERSYAASSSAAVEAVRVPDPASDQKRFAVAVAALAERIRADVVLPGTDLAIAALTAHADCFAPGIALGLLPTERVERATDKTALAGLARVAGFAVPATRVTTREDLEAIDLPFPVVVKPSRSDVEDPRGEFVHGHAHRVEDASQLRQLAQVLEGDTWVVQPYIDGDLVAVAGVAWEGTVVAAIETVAHRIWPPDCGGSSYASTIAPDPERERRVTSLIRELGWSGIFQAQVLRAGGEDFLIDFNPRFYGTLALALAAGVNLPALWIDLLRGVEPPRRPSYRVGVRFRAGWKDIRALALIVRAGRWGEAVAGILPRRHTCHPVFSWKDPRPALVGFTRIARKLAASIAGRSAENA